MRLKTKAQHQIVPGGHKGSAGMGMVRPEGGVLVAGGAVRFRRCGRGAGESGSADRTFSPINAYRKELRGFFFLSALLRVRFTKKR